MSLLRLTLVIVILLAVPTRVHCSEERGAGPEEPLTVKLELLSENPTQGQPVSFEVRLEASEAIWVPNSLSEHENLQLIIVDPQGASVHHVRSHVKRQPRTYGQFANSMSGEKISAKVILAGFHFLLPGRYTISVIFHSDDSGSAAEVQAWTGSVRSKPIEIEVAEDRELRGKQLRFVRPSRPN